MPLGRYTGNNYRPARKSTMLQPVQDVTQFATGFPQQQPASAMQALPPSPVDPAYEAFLRGEDSRGTYTRELIEADDSDYRAWKIDRGLPLYDR